MFDLIIAKISKEMNLKEPQVRNTCDLMFKDECTIPFVARYRKEKTGSLDEEQLRTIRDRYLYLQELEGSKVKYLKVVEEHVSKNPELAPKLAELRKKFMACSTKQELEDLYLPFKPKRRTRAKLAKDKGLEPLADKIFNAKESLTDLLGEAAAFVTPAGATIAAELVVTNAEDALAGAADILCERFAETAEIRGVVRKLSMETGVLCSKSLEAKAAVTEAEQAQAVKPKEKDAKAGKYDNYFNYRESINTAPAHRVMAVRRGEAEKVLKVDLEVDVPLILRELNRLILGDARLDAKIRAWFEGMIEDSYKRLISTSIETEIRLFIKNRAEEDAIRVFSQNLQSLLLLPPMPNKIVLGVDPGLRTGSKLAVVSETGKFLHHTIVYPVYEKPDNSKTIEAKEAFVKVITDYKVNYIAVGNGTGGREVFRLIRGVLKEKNLTEVKIIFVNEAGASVYSTDQIARAEFPDLDPTIRSAISIARRLQDPLAELVKIDPRSIGVGQYQHDVNVTRLKNSLEEIVESCVNRVGVNLNSASVKLLSYVSGIGPVLAQNIVAYRDKTGRFESRDKLKEVVGFGAKAFQQATGFLRVPESTNALDNSAVHPERYEIVEQIAKDLNLPLPNIVGRKEIINAIPLEKYVNAAVGMPTLKDIAAELLKPGRDPRDETARVQFSDDICELEDLKVGMELQGNVSNVTNFGAFVDIGVHQDGLIHISEISDEFVKDPSTVLAVGDIVKVRVIDVDLTRRRISLSRKTPRQAPQTPAGPAMRQQGGPAPQQHQQQPQRHHGRAPHHKQRPHEQRQQAQQHRQPPPKTEPKPYSPKFTVDDLLSKFNKRG